MVEIGIVSNAYKSKNKFGINFKKAFNDGFGFFDYQGFLHSSSKLYKLSDKAFEKFLLDLKGKMKENGLAFSQLHALWDMEQERLGNNFDRLFEYDCKAIYGAYLLDCPVVVIHTISIAGWWPIEDEKEMYKLNVEYFKRLVPIAKKYNIKIGIENLPFTYLSSICSVESTYKLIKEVNSEYVGMCLDTGHMNMFRIDPYDTIVSIKDKLFALHVHDNNSQSDSHSYPYQGNIDWDRFIKALKDINFNKVISFEVCAPENMPKKAKRCMEKALALIALDIKNKINI